MLSESWFSIRISEAMEKRPSRKTSVFISVPKKIVPLATDRNRIKRLIKEAVREDSFFKNPEKSFLFRVTKAPKSPSLNEVKQGIRQWSGK